MNALSGADLASLAPDVADRRVEEVLDLSGDTLAEPPISGLIALALSPDGKWLVTMQDTIDRALTLKVFPFTLDRRIRPDEGRVLLALDHPYVHSGGGLVIDDAGDVLVALGAYRHPDRAMGLQNPDGVVLRVPAAAVRGDEPTPYQPSDANLLATGLRNPWRMTLDRATGDLWIGDVGDGTAEEINLLPAEVRRSGRAPNFGFPFLEGDTELLAVPQGAGPFSPPFWFHGRDEPGVAIIGGYVYRGGAIPWLRGRYLFSDNADPFVRSLTVPWDGAAPETLGKVPDRPTSFGEGVDGELYVITASGSVQRVVDSGNGRDVAFEQVGSIWPQQPSHSQSEGTALVAVPDGSGLVAAERSGVITFVPFDTDPGDLCQLVWDQLPSRPLVLEQQQGYVEGALALVEQYGPLLPEQFEQERLTVLSFLRSAADVGRSAGWASPELYRFLRVAALERGPHAAAQRAESRIANYVDGRCPG